MQAGSDAGSNKVGCEDCAERKPGGQRFGKQDDVRLGWKFLVSEVPPGAAEAALNFVGDEQSAILRRKRASAIPEAFRNRVNAAFTLNGFQDYSANCVVKFGFEIGDIVEADKFDAGHQRSKRQAIFLRGGDTQGAEGASVKGIVHRQDAMLGRRLVRRIGGGTCAKASEFQGTVGSFSAAVREEDSLHSGNFREFAGERSLIGVVVEIGEMNGARGFAANHFYDARMSVAEGVDGDAAEKIEILLPRRVVYIRSATVGDQKRLTLVGRQ